MDQAVLLHVQVVHMQKKKQENVNLVMINVMNVQDQIQINANHVLYSDI